MLCLEYALNEANLAHLLRDARPVVESRLNTFLPLVSDCFIGRVSRACRWTINSSVIVAQVKVNV